MKTIYNIRQRLDNLENSLQCKNNYNEYWKLFDKLWKLERLEKILNKYNFKFK